MTVKAIATTTTHLGKAVVPRLRIVQARVRAYAPALADERVLLEAVVLEVEVAVDPLGGRRLNPRVGHANLQSVGHLGARVVDEGDPDGGAALGHVQPPERLQGRFLGVHASANGRRGQGAVHQM